MSLLFAILLFGQTSVKDGSFTDPGVWSSPLSRDSDVTIKHRVTLSESIEVRTIRVAAEGSLEVSGNTVVTFTDYPIDTVADPEQLTHGLLVFGRLRVQGRPQTAYVRLYGDLQAGTSFIPLEAVPNSWRPGETLYVPDTRQPDHSSNPAGKPLQHEFRQIRQVRGDGVLLDRPLDYSHLGARDADGKPVFFPAVANLTRSIVFRSENPAGVRAHAYFTERADVFIEGASFLDMGRTTGERLSPTNIKGRYAVHFHHLMGPARQPVSNPYQFVFSGCVVWSQAPASRWGITVHHSHYGLIHDNVVITAAGSGIVTEDGNETGNVFEGNYVANITGEGRPDARPNEIGFEGSAYWFRGGNNFHRNNLAYLSKDGFVFYPRFAPTSFRYPSVPGGMEDTPIDPCRVPIRSFVGNEVCSCSIGFSNWFTGAIDRTPVDTISESVIDGLRVWHTRSGVSNYESGRFVFRDYVAIGDRRTLADSGGWGASDYVQWRVRIEGGRIENYNSGIRAPAIADRLDASGTNPGLFVVRGIKLRCRNNFSVPIPWHNASASRLPPITVHMENVNLQPLDSSREQRHLRLGLRSSEFTNYAQWVSVNFHQGPISLRWFGPNQSPKSILPASTPDSRVIGAPFAMPNDEAWRTYGVAAGGAIAPPNIIVTPDNDAGCIFVKKEPFIRPVPDMSIQPGQSWSYGVCAYDPSLGELEYSIKGPKGMAIENRSGRINWNGSSEEEDFPVTVTARDVDDGKTVKHSFTLRVRKPTR